MLSFTNLHIYKIYIIYSTHLHCKCEKESLKWDRKRKHSYFSRDILSNSFDRENYGLFSTKKSRKSYLVSYLFSIWKIKRKQNQTKYLQNKLSNIPACSLLGKVSRDHGLLLCTSQWDKYTKGRYSTEKWMISLWGTLSLPSSLYLSKCSLLSN